QEQRDGEGDKWVRLVEKQAGQVTAGSSVTDALGVLRQTRAQPTLLEGVGHGQAGNDQIDAAHGEDAQGEQSFNAMLTPGKPDHWTTSSRCWSGLRCPPSGGGACMLSLVCRPRLR